MKLTLKKQGYIAAYLFIAPVMIGYLAFVFVPALSVFVLSTLDWNMLREPIYIGLSNFKTLLKDVQFLNSLKVTANYVLYFMPVWFMISMLLALALKALRRGMTVYRTIVLIPWITTPMAISIVWRWILNARVGMVNIYLEMLGISPPNWLSADLALITVTAVNVWLSVGFTAVLLFVGMQSIPNDYYEAADVDGVGEFGKFFFITIPLLKPTILYVTITGLINSFQVFDSVYGMTQGGPGTTTTVVYYMIYREAFMFMRFGSSSAMCAVLFVILMFFTLLQLLAFREKD